MVYQFWVNLNIRECYNGDEGIRCHEVDDKILGFKDLGAEFKY